jgi:hypothetical protein
MRIWLRETRRGRASFQVLQEFIVAAAEASPCGFFLTEDFQTGPERRWTIGCQPV